MTLPVEAAKAFSRILVRTESLKTLSEKARYRAKRETLMNFPSASWALSFMPKGSEPAKSVILSVLCL